MITEYKIMLSKQYNKTSGIAKHNVDAKTIKIWLKCPKFRDEFYTVSKTDIDLTDVDMGFIEFVGDFDQIATYEICATYKNINVVVKANIENGCIALKSATEEGYALELLRNFVIINMIKREILPQILTQYINNLGADYG